MAIEVLPPSNECGLRLAEAVQQYLLWMIKNNHADRTIKTHERLLKHFQNFINKRKLPWEVVFTHETLQSFEKDCRLNLAKSAVRGLARNISSPIEKPRAAMPDIYEQYLKFYEATQSMGRRCLNTITRSLSALF